MKFLLSLLLAVPAVLAKVKVERASGPDVVENQYIAVYNENAQFESVTKDFQQKHSINATRKIQIGNFKAIVFTGNPTVLNNIEMSDNNDIKRVSPQRKFYPKAALPQLPDKPKPAGLVTQNNATWNLARISHRKNGAKDYVYDGTAGKGVSIYIVDTGIYKDNKDFEDRVVMGPNFSYDDQNTDVNGHGTHLAGIAGGKTYGVAKKATLVSVKVCGNQGYAISGDILAGFEWIVNAQKGRTAPYAVIGLSLGGKFDQTYNDAIAAVVREGIFMSVSAGNDFIDARGESPASEPTVCTVGATDMDDVLAFYSNYGPVVDIYAPGSKILSTYIGTPDATKVLSGTSMAQPHIAGLAAYLIGLEGPRSPQELCARIQKLATRGVLTGFPKEDPNNDEPSHKILAFNGATKDAVKDVSGVESTVEGTPQNVKATTNNVKAASGKVDSVATLKNVKLGGGHVRRGLVSAPTYKAPTYNQVNSVHGNSMTQVNEVKQQSNDVKTWSQGTADTPNEVKDQPDEVKAGLEGSVDDTKPAGTESTVDDTKPAVIESTVDDATVAGTEGNVDDTKKAGTKGTVDDASEVKSETKGTVDNSNEVSKATSGGQIRKGKGLKASKVAQHSNNMGNKQFNNMADKQFSNMAGKAAQQFNNMANKATQQWPHFHNVDGFKGNKAAQRVKNSMDDAIMGEKVAQHFNNVEGPKANKRPQQPKSVSEVKAQQLDTINEATTQQLHKGGPHGQ